MPFAGGFGILPEDKKSTETTKESPLEEATNPILERIKKAYPPITFIPKRVLRIPRTKSHTPDGENSSGSTPGGDETDTHPLSRISPNTAGILPHHLQAGQCLRYHQNYKRFQGVRRKGPGPFFS